MIASTRPSDYARVEAIESLPPRLGTSVLFPPPAGGYLSLDRWRTREWYDAPESRSAVLRPQSQDSEDAIRARAGVLEETSGNA